MKNVCADILHGILVGPKYLDASSTVNKEVEFWTNLGAPKAEVMNLRMFHFIC